MSAVLVTSAGTLAQPGLPMDPAAGDQLARRAASLSGFVTQRLTPGMVEDADLILTATREHRGDVVTLVPTALPRTFTFGECARLLSVAGAPPGRSTPASVAAIATQHRGYPGAGAGDDLADPVGLGRRAFARTTGELSSLLVPLVRWLGG
jgi:protein-tyrosine phosphatase